VSASKPPKPPRKRVIKKPSVAKSKEVKAVPKASVKREEEERTRIRVKIMAYDHKVIDKTTKIIIETARRSGAETVGPIPLPTNIKKFTLLRSTFVHKDARDQYEIRTHKRLIDIYDPTQKTIEDLTNLSLPAGVDIEIKM
jgi:small subunit ribosomal protein S10